MKDGVAGEHLNPELFVDLLEAAPVEAERRQHLASCVECRRELRDLEEALGMVKAEARGGSRFRRYGLWAGAAAAIVAAVALFYRSIPLSEPQPEAAEIRLLAPIGEDPDYGILEALSPQLESDDALALPFPDFPDASELNSRELQDLLERLARETDTTS